MVMKRLRFGLFSIIWTLCIISTSHAQKSGVVTYQKVIDYGIEPMGKPRWDDFIKDLPKTGTFIYNLSFAGSESLFEEDMSQRADADPRLQRALNAVSSFTPPKAEVLQIYQNIEEGQKLERVAFMTRYFIVENKLEKPAWKIIPDKKKILDYICAGAEMNTEQGTVTAWFTPQIPVQFGPDGYHGLPGLIMGIERNGDMVVLASNVEMDALDALSAPDDGQKVEQKDFDQIVKDKVMEWKAYATSKGRAKKN